MTATRCSVIRDTIIDPLHPMRPSASRRLIQCQKLSACHLICFLLALGNGSSLALNWKCGIDLTLSGTEGKDYVIEQLYHDDLVDDRSVFYLKSSVQIEMAHNARNIAPDGKSTEGGWIYFKLDGDGLRTGYPYGLGELGPDPMFSPPLFLYQSPIDLTSLRGQRGEFQGEGRGTSYHMGIPDAFGDTWHVLTYWDDEGGGTKIGQENNSNDGKIVLLVLDPVTPALRLIKQADNSEYYTTPPKQYYIPKIFPQTTYLTSGVVIELTNLGGANPVFYRVDEGPWQIYTAALPSQEIFGTKDKAHILSYRCGDLGEVKTRRFHYEPSSPTAAEVHPSRMIVHSPGDLAALQTRMLESPYAEGYNAMKDMKNVRGGYDRYRNGLRYGKREYQISASNLAKHAFVCLIEGYPHESFLFADTAKAILLNLYTIDPVSFEAGQITGCRKAPCMERGAYPGDHKTPDVPLGYDMMASYTTGNGYINGFTPIEEYKVRDSLASEVNLRLKWFGVPYGYGDFWQAFLEGPLQAFAIAMPTYDTPYYGTSVVDGRTATHAFTPFPDQLISWWDFCNNKGEAPGYPNLGAKSIFYNLVKGPYGLGNWGEDGFWHSDDTAGYQNLSDAGWIPSLAARAKYDGSLPPRMAAYLDMSMVTRNPVNRGSFPSNASKDFVYPNVRTLIQRGVPDAGLYMWHLATPEPRAGKLNNVFELLYFDNTIEARPPLHESRRYQSVLSFGKDLGSKDAILFRILNKHEPTDRSNYRLPLTTHFNLCAYGEMLVVDGIKNRDDVAGRSAEGRNAVMVGDAGVSNTLDGRISQSLFTDLAVPIHGTHRLRPDHDAEGSGVGRSWDLSQAGDRPGPPHLLSGQEVLSDHRRDALGHGQPELRVDATRFVRRLYHGACVRDGTPDRNLDQGERRATEGPFHCTPS